MAGPRKQWGAVVLPPALGSLGGLLYAASIPKLDLPVLAWACLVPPLSYLLVRAGHGRPVAVGPAAAMGLAFGLVAGLGRIYWIAETLVNYGGLGPAMATVTNALLVLYLALYPACFTVVAARLAPPGADTSRGMASAVAFPWLAAAAWVGLEWIQGWLFTGFPWFLLGYSQFRYLALIQFASVAGVYGVSFVLVAASAAAAAAAAHLWGRRGWRGAAVILAPVTALVLGLHLFGVARLAALEKPGGELVRFGVVQGNIPQDLKWKAGRRTSATADLYADLTRELVAAHPDVDAVLFPETALPFYFNDPAYAPYAEPIRDLARQVQRPILVGSLEGSARDRCAPVYNRAYMLDGNGAIAGHADKVHLVPFGEYLPLPQLFQYLKGLTAESGRFTHGAGHRTVPLPGTAWDLGVFICYESIFPEITRVLTRRGADILVNTTNDAWFGTTAAPHQHFAMAAVRAVETGRAVVRAANTGISGAIGPNGVVLAATPLFATQVLTVEVPARREITPYVALGDWLVWLCLAAVAGRAAIALWRRGTERTRPGWAGGR